MSEAYAALREVVEELGGTMVHKRGGYRYGAWIVTLDGKERVFPGMGDKTLPDLDKYYQPKPGITEPKDWDDYTSQLREGAAEEWRRVLTRG